MWFHQRFRRVLPLLTSSHFILIAPICKNLSHKTLLYTLKKIKGQTKKSPPPLIQQGPISASGIRLLSWIDTSQMHTNAVSQILQSREAVL